MHHAYSVLALLYLVDKGLHTKRIYTSHLSHIISVLVIPNEFPTILAKREIIANAFLLSTMSWKRLPPNLSAKVQRIIEIIVSFSEKVFEESVFLSLPHFIIFS